MDKAWFTGIFTIGITWCFLCDNNTTNKARAAFDANYTFDGGDGPIDRSTTTSASKSNTIEFAKEVDHNFAVGIGLEIAGIGVSGGFNVNMKLETGNSTTTTSTNTTTIGYVLDDDDLYDSYTVDVKKDRVQYTYVCHGGGYHQLPARTARTKQGCRAA